MFVAVAALLSAALPVADLQALLDAARPGSQIVLPDGLHSGAWLQDREFQPPILVRAANPGKAFVAEHPDTKQALWLTRCRGLLFDGISFVSRASHVLHVDGTPLPEPKLSRDLVFRDCQFVLLAETDHFCVKASQAERLVFRECTFVVTQNDELPDYRGGCFDAVAVDELLLRRCRFDNLRHGVVLMVKGGSKQVVVEECEFDCPGTVPSLFFGNVTGPQFRTRRDVRFELEDFRFRANRVAFRDSPLSTENVHGVFDALGSARIEENRFSGVGQVLFSAKRSVADLEGCRNIGFRDNLIALRPAGLKSEWNAVIVSQSEREGDEARYVPILPASEFEASGNRILVPEGTIVPKLGPLLKVGFEIQQQGAPH